MSASLGAADAVPPTGSPILARFGPLNLPESRLSSVQLSPNRVRSDFDVETEDLAPLFGTSPVSDGDLSLISPATTDSEGEAESFHSAGVSQATSASMSITHRTALSTIRDETDPALLLQLATAYHKWLPQPPPDPVPILFREGPFDAATCPATTSEHPLITNQRDGCPYIFKSYRDYEYSLVDTPFGLQVHHPQFLERVGAPESARLLSQPPAEWLRVMSREQTLHAALQLQRDTSLLSSNINVMQQYAISLYRTASDILQLVFGRHFFPSAAVNDTVPKLF